MKGKEFMAAKISTGFLSSPASRSAFVIVFGLVFAFVFMSSIIVTFILPEAYASTARIKIDGNTGGSSAPSRVYDPNLLQTELRIIESEVILDKVIDELDLNEVWRRKYNFEGKFKTSESRQALKRMVELRPARNTSLADVVVYSDDRMEAAKIANSIAETYQAYRQGVRTLQTKDAIHEVAREWTVQGKKISNDQEALIADFMAEVNRRTAEGPVVVEIIEHAEPSSRPVRPNKSLNIALGGFSAGFMGVVAGAIAAFVVSRIQHGGRKMPPPISQPI
jgi:uncharacterized protein involved in exopolysaccharide biosynthesis